MDRLPKLIGELYRIVDELEEMYPGQKFTPDGHLLGSIGEALAKKIYGLELKSASTKDYDGKIGDKTVQVKLTARNRVSISATGKYADLLIVLQLNRKVGFKEVFAGVFPVQLLNKKNKTIRGYRLCSTRALQDLNVHEFDSEKKINLVNAGFREETR